MDDTNSLHPAQKILMKVFRITDEDLEANRQGLLSQRQYRRLQGIRTQKIIRYCVGVILIVAVL